MQTRCPNPQCLYLFAIDTDSVVHCPSCSQIMTPRPLSVLKQIDRLQALAKGNVAQIEKDNPPQTKIDSPTNRYTYSGLLEDIRSLWNVGSMFRTADGSGISHLYLCGITGCPPRSEIAKTSLGAEANITWDYHSGALSILPKLRQEQTFVLGLEYAQGLSYVKNSVPLGEAIAEHSIKTPVCIVVGNEVNGLSAETLSVCDLICHLPMRGIKESLNVAVAFGVAAYLLTTSLDC